MEEFINDGSPEDRARIAGYLQLLLLERLRRVLRNAYWRDDAQCREIDQDMFFPEKGAKNVSREAISLCGRCEVAEQCLNYAMTNHPVHGVWGGTTEYHRRIRIAQWRRDREEVAA